MTVKRIAFGFGQIAVQIGGEEFVDIIVNDHGLIQRGEGGAKLLAHRGERATEDSTEFAIRKAKRVLDCAIIHFLEVAQRECGPMKLGQISQSRMKVSI
jgi:hypothetical protein